jgi:predicted DCC family thiol-disulfide oxidoreductase YuxK
MKTQGNDDAIVIFDGVCVLCSKVVRFIIRHDKREVFKFAALQEKTAQRLLAGRDKEGLLPATVILIENGKFYYRSTAALRILKKLTGIWPLFYGLVIIPVPIRDFVYTFVAERRYRWFGKFDKCRIPGENLKKRFPDHAQ